MTRHTTTSGMIWQPSWGQAMTDFRGEDEEAAFDNITVRITVPASIGGDHVRIELSNQFGDEPVHIERAAIGTDGVFVDVTFGGTPTVEIPAGESLWTDPVVLPVRHGEDVVIDLYLPEPTPYATANGFTFDRSVPGDFAGTVSFLVVGSTPVDVNESREFPVTNTGTEQEADGTGWSLPAGGPFLRTIEVVGSAAVAVIVCLGSSSTAMGWPQYTAELLPASAGIAIINRGISGNRLLRDAPPTTPSWGRAGLNRFVEDVLNTDGVTHVVIAYNTNDWTLPGRVTPTEEMPTAAEVIGAYQELVHRSQTAGLEVTLATTTPLSPELAGDTVREGIRVALNDWIRTSGHTVVDFDIALRSEDDPARLDPRYAAPDNTHPNINGQKRLAQTTAAVLLPRGSSAALDIG
jgi:lysophospholipase L1-like esterase